MLTIYHRSDNSSFFSSFFQNFKMITSFWQYQCCQKIQLIRRQWIPDYSKHLLDSLIAKVNRLFVYCFSCRPNVKHYFHLYQCLGHLPRLQQVLLIFRRIRRMTQAKSNLIQLHQVYLYLQFCSKEQFEPFDTSQLE